MSSDRLAPGRLSNPGPCVVQGEPQLVEGEIRVTGVEYGSLMEALESDHKPVYAVLRVNIPITDQVCACRHMNHLVPCFDVALVTALYSPTCPGCTWSKNESSVENRVK